MPTIEVPFNPGRRVYWIGGSWQVYGPDVVRYLEIYPHSQVAVLDTSGGYNFVPASRCFTRKRDAERVVCRWIKEAE